MGYVDWEFAKTTGRNLVPAGPSVGPRRGARRRSPPSARPPVPPAGRSPRPRGCRRRRTPPTPSSSTAPRGSPSTPTRCAPCSTRPSTPSSRSAARRPAPTAQAIGGKVTGAEAGALLAFMAPKVLGQYDLAPDGTPALLLVAPNLMAVADELGVDRDDFRLWVCMHEETHRVQFTANPWLRDHVIEQARGARGRPRARHRAAAGGRQPGGREAPGDLQGGQRRPRRPRDDPRAARADGGAHRGHVAARGPRRRRHGRRRARRTSRPSSTSGPASPRSARAAGAADRVLRRLLGLEAKMRQYRDGAAFVRGVQEAVGVDGFNAVWTSPETLPLAREIEDPRSWVRRVHGSSGGRRREGGRPHPAVAAVRRRRPGGPGRPRPRRPRPRRVQRGRRLAGARRRPRLRRRRAGPARPAAVVVDHGLQDGSADVAARGGRRPCAALGLDPVEVVTVTVPPATGEGLEAAARTARYAALEEAAARLGAAVVLLGHTRDDQAEQVLLGLVRGSGARSLAGMPAARDHLRRPLLGTTREQTRAACEAEGLAWWDDPMNEDPAFTRVRARRALADLERDLGPGVAAALARTADLLREDADHLDGLADVAVARARRRPVGRRGPRRPAVGGPHPGAGAACCGRPGPRPDSCPPARRRLRPPPHGVARTGPRARPGGPPGAAGSTVGSPSPLPLRSE